MPRRLEITTDKSAEGMVRGAAVPGCGCVRGVYAKEPLIDDGPVKVYRTLHLYHALTRHLYARVTA
ncbi:hypothetical protein Acor_34500 [Acrocarpospora corrugata]|uniref:Uncharacterized protein n=1 Tax=Acrocarpospora corrugata TaxID=35763 RepID=A0A5M3VXX7_9ACTN|nr:hypothetical protein [Acrocarpospora corrugata]GES01386.1 hypothetical protein Acor_34500 [Acrocarpospora corrugata]